TYGYTIAHGDNRSFSPSSGMAQRVQQQMTIQPVSGRVLSSSGSPNQSTQYEHYSSVGTDTTGNVVPLEDQTYYDCFKTNQIGTASYTPGVNPGITPRGTPPTASEEFTGNVSYPFNPASPGIKWDITLSLTPQANSGTTNFTVLNNGHTCFPAFEIYMNNSPVYQYSPPSNDFWNYITPCLVGYNSSGQSTLIYTGNAGAINQ
ncbi:MAG TPA: hypothetical protein VKY31_16945, partial [Terriglobia bacterium]|nr:hypothetical protein [Terriglobia bacterium]